MPNTLLTLRDVAKMLRVSERTLHRWHVARKGPPRVSAGKKPLYRLEGVNEWIEVNETRPLSTFGGRCLENE